MPHFMVTNRAGIVKQPARFVKTMSRHPALVRYSEVASIA